MMAALLSSVWGARSLWHRWCLVCVALAAGWSLLIAAASAQDGGQSISLAEYQTRLGTIIRQLEAVPDRATGPALDQARTDLATISAVDLPSGVTIDVSSPLPAFIDRADALARLRLLQDQLAAAANDNTAARQARLRAILARSEFVAPDGTASLLDRALEWIRDWIPADLIVLPGGLANTLGAVVIVAGLVGITVLLSYWLQGFLRGFVSNAEARRRQGDGADVPLTAAAARQQAAALAQGGDYRQAMRQLYLAALLRLDELGTLRYDRSQTNREVLAQLPTTSVTHTHLEPVVDTFDRIWYGVREPDQDTFHAYAREVDWLTSAIDPAVDENKPEAPA